MVDNPPGYVVMQMMRAMRAGFICEVKLDDLAV